MRRRRPHLLLLALSLLAAGSAAAGTTVDRRVRESMDATSSSERERGLYALMRLHDPAVRDDRDLVDRAFFAGTSIERAAALRGACDRAGALSPADSARVLEALDSQDIGLRTAAIECLEKLPPKAAASARLEQLEDIEGQGLPPLLTRAVLASVVRHPDARAREILERFANRMELKGGTQFTDLTADGAWLILALAANGRDVEPLFAETLLAASETNYALRARLNRIRAARGDVAALSALVETANVAIDFQLRREAIDLLLSLPAGPRGKAVLALQSRLLDMDGQVRARLVRELSREAVALDAAGEAMLVQALGDPFPDLRFQAAAGLLDRAAAGTLSADALAGARSASATEKDRLVASAFERLFARADSGRP